MTLDPKPYPKISKRSQHTIVLSITGEPVKSRVDISGDRELAFDKDGEICQIRWDIYPESAWYNDDNLICEYGGLNYSVTLSKDEIKVQNLTAPSKV